MVIYIFIFICFFLFVLYIPFPLVMKFILRRRFLTSAEQSNAVYLTFDDGPHPESTPRILDMLKKAGVKATFFVLGENIDRYPQIAHSIVSKGHELGEHGYSHTHAWFSSPFRYFLDLKRSSQTIEKYNFSAHRTSFRPPYGKLNFMTLIYILVHRLRVVFWNLDPKDYEQVSEKSVSQIVTRNISKGSVVLLHDGRRAGQVDPSVTVAALESILKDCAGRNFHFATVRDALANMQP